MNLPNPIHPQWQGPRTPKDHSISTEHEHMRACLDELTFYCGVNFSGRLEIGRVQHVGPDGYAPGRFGRYFGAGLPLYEIDCLDVQGDLVASREVRAPDRRTLRAALAARWPRATVGR